MKKIVIISLCLVVMVALFAGCGKRRLGLKKILTIPPEKQAQYEQNKQQMEDILEIYKERYGMYPRNLDQLKDANFNYPAPLEGGQWEYSYISPYNYMLNPVVKDENGE